MKDKDIVSYYKKITPVPGSYTMAVLNGYVYSMNFTKRQKTARIGSLLLIEVLPVALQISVAFFSIPMAITVISTNILLQVIYPCCKIAFSKAKTSKGFSRILWPLSVVPMSIWGLLSLVERVVMIPVNAALIILYSVSNKNKLSVNASNKTLARETEDSQYQEVSEVYRSSLYKSSSLYEYSLCGSSSINQKNQNGIGRGLGIAGYFTSSYASSKYPFGKPDYIKEYPDFNIKPDSRIASLDRCSSRLMKEGMNNSSPLRSRNQSSQIMNSSYPLFSRDEGPSRGNDLG